MLNLRIGHRLIQNIQYFLLDFYKLENNLFSIQVKHGFFECIQFHTIIVLKYDFDWIFLFFFYFPPKTHQIPLKRHKIPQKAQHLRRQFIHHFFIKFRLNDNTWTDKYN